MFLDLQSYGVLAWDFDETLIKHQKSPLFWQFIIDNPFSQVHHIVTMRSHGMERTMFLELALEGSGLKRAHFEEVIALPNTIYESYMKERLQNGSATPNHAYHLFKGEHCARLGAEALIDDMEAEGVSVRGCDLHGIMHYHPDDLVSVF